MAGLAKAMLRRATHDLDHAGRALADGDFDWACLAAQQAAEKALKAVLLHAGLPANPQHNLSRIFDALVGGGITDPGAKAALQDHLSFLTLAFTFSRYPDEVVATAPADLVTAEDAQRALTAGKAVLAAARHLASELDTDE